MGSRHTGETLTNARQCRKKRIMARSTLTFKENFELMKLIEQDYLVSNKSDTEFAKYANEKIGTNKINRDHIEQRRPVFGLESNNPRHGREKQDTILLTLLARLEKRIDALEKQIQAMM